MPRFPTSLTDSAIPAPGLVRVDVLLERAAAAERHGRAKEAQEIYQRINRLDPTQIDALNALGGAAGNRGDVVAAIGFFEQSLRIAPEQPVIWFNHGLAMSRLGLHEKALYSFERAVALVPDHGNGHLLVATTLARLGRWEEALAAYGDTLRLLPHDPVTANQHAEALLWTGQTEAAMAEFDRAIALDEGYPEARLSKALLLLMRGQFAEGFEAYEWRWKLPLAVLGAGRTAREDTAPLWLGGSDLAGKTLLIYREQGFGDTLNFCRYASMAADAGARVILEVQPPLVELMKSVPGVSLVISDEEPLPAHDLRCPTMSLPLAFRTTAESIPAPIPYVSADPGKVAIWAARLSPLAGLRVGLTWRAGSRVGDAAYTAIEQRKSVPLKSLAPLATVSGCAFVSIQVGSAPEEPPPGLSLVDHTADLTNFAETAALIDNLDLVISVCTATAHLAGAMGKPVWLLNRFDTDWRWGLEGETTPWYPSMRIFRQKKPADWDLVIQDVAEALRSLAKAR